MDSADEQLQRCLELLRRAGIDQAAGELLRADVPSLLGNEAIAGLLVARVAALDAAAVDAEAEEKGLLECLLDEARRAVEDDRPAGPRFIAAAEAALESLDPETVSAAGIVALGSVYHRAGLEVPAVVRSLQASRLTAEEYAGTDDPASLAAGLADSIVEMREQCGNDPFAVYLTLGDSMAALPDEGCEALVHEIARWEDGFWQQLSLYWLLDPRAALRRAAATAIRELADAGRIADGVAGRLTWVRSLLPQGEVLQSVDAALAAYRKRHRGWPQPEDSGAIDEARASVPDGAGAQYLALGKRSASGYNWSMVLIKSGHGVRDAYVLADIDPTAEEELWSTLADAADIRPVSRATVTALLGAALAENLAKGEVPAPGLIDVAIASGLTDLRPRAASGRDWLRDIDPDQRLTNLTPQKRGRLINRSAEWDDELDVLASWFEDNTEANAILEGEGPGRRRERALREYLETRREWWAELCLRSALVVQHDDVDELSASLAVTGLALLDGREFKRLPLLESILGATIAAHDGAPLADEAAMIASDIPLPLDDAEGEHEGVQPGVLVDPAQARLQPLFDGDPVTRQWSGGYFGLHGYLFAIATHAELLPPSQWLEPVFDVLRASGAGPEDEAGAKTLLSDLCNLYNLINEEVMDLHPVLPQGCAMQSVPADNLRPDAPFGQWSLGFTRAREHFGHLADTSFEETDDNDGLHEAIELATEMIEFFGNPDETTSTNSPRGAAIDDLAAVACEHFGENLQILCATRMWLQTEMAEASDDTLSDRTGADAGPLTPQAILAWLDEPGASYQWEAMDRAVAQQSAITPLLLQRLEEVIEAPREWINRDQAGLLYAMALLGHFAEPAAHQPFLRLAALPEDVQDPLLGDVTTELLPVVLWRTSGGETAGLKRLIEDRTAYGFGRCAGAEALVFGVLFGQLDRTEINAYLAALLEDETFAPRGDSAWFGLVHALLNLYPDEHETAVREFLRHRNPDPFGMRELDLDAVMADDRETALEQERQSAAWRFPDDVHGYLSHWAGFQPTDPDWTGEDRDAFFGPNGPGYDPDFPPIPDSTGATKSRGPSPDKKKKKRKQQKKARKTNRKRR